MIRHRLAFAALGLILFTFASITLAEPWISNRYAQNCSGCHAPARRNLPMMDRRCTLACQGCHVNPSGGGLRSSYGVWNQQRWLRSFKSKLFRSPGTPAPLKYQKYAKMPKKLNPKDKKDQRYLKMAKDGPSLAVLPGVDYNEKDYDKHDNEWKIEATRGEFLARVTDNDPWRIERRQSVFAGGDFRYIMTNGEQKGGGITRKIDWSMPMSFDIGVRVRPIPEHVQLVFEHRYYNTPPGVGLSESKSDILWTTDGGGVNRSAYVLIDDLPFATYVQYGNYRPMFGHYTPDHTTLLNNLLFSGEGDGPEAPTSKSARESTYRVLSIGGSPNVPFANFHWIKPRKNSDTSDEASSAEGYAINLGGRFVTLGLSGMLSIWSTKAQLAAGTPPVKRDMIGFTAGGQFGRFTANVDFTTVKRQQTAMDKGSVQTLEVKYRLWRENYAIFNYATANTSRNLKNGEAREMMYGFKSFLLEGTELEFLIIDRHDRTNDAPAASYDTKLMQLQAHLYF